MDKQSPEQYLKYLTALSLAMTASAGAQSTSAAPAEESFKAPRPSVNLESLAEAVSSEGQEQAAGYVAGCTGWPESTYVRRIIKVPTVTPAVESSNLEVLAEAVSSEGQEQAAGYVAGCMGWPESTYVRRIIIKIPTVTSAAERSAAAEASLESTIEDVLGDLA
jgi:hypothetical protein